MMKATVETSHTTTVKWGYITLYDIVMDDDLYTGKHVCLLYDRLALRRGH